MFEYAVQTFGPMFMFEVCVRYVRCHACVHALRYNLIVLIRCPFAKTENFISPDVNRKKGHTNTSYNNIKQYSNDHGSCNFIILLSMNVYNIT
jgi:hypothetical protein